MKSNKWLINIPWGVIAALISSASSFVGTVLSICVSEMPCSAVLHIIIIFVTYISVPILCGLFILKDNTKIRDNYISLLIPTLIMWLVMTALMYVTIGNDNLGFTLAYMNFPGFFLSGHISSDTDIAFSIVVGFSQVFYLLLSSFGLVLQKHLRE